MNQIFAAIFPDFVAFLSWHFCGNNEAEGTCFLQVPTAVYSHYEPTTCVWSSLVLPGGEGVNSGGAVDSCWTLSPSVTPCFLLPDELWLAGLIVCAQQTDVGSLTGLSNLHPLLKWKKETYDIQLCGRWYPVTVNRSHKSFGRKKDFCATYFNAT